MQPHNTSNTTTTFIVVATAGAVADGGQWVYCTILPSHLPASSKGEFELDNYMDNLWNLMSYDNL